MDGSIVLVQKTEEYSDGDIVIVNYNGDSMCKRYKKISRGYNLVPDNSNGNFRTINNRQIKDCYFQGKVVKVLNIDSDAKIGYTYDADNNIRALTIESENIILTGPTDPTQDEFPVSDVINVINFPFTNSFKTDKDKLLNAMQVAELFIVPNSDKDSCNVEVNGTTNTMRVVNFNQQANLLLPIVGSTVPNASYKLNIQKVIAALKNIDSAEIEIFVSVNNSNIIKITDGTLNEVLSVTSFE